ncbi:MAG: 30S ribosomal protein S20 [Erysipelothrix sp.]|jgi:small subunit ribosomal protein S20|nr:30S ribosomal protein S20 [Erysipelothrix sp.]
MPNIKSQKKRAITNMKREAANTSQRSAMKTKMKLVRNLVEAGDLEKATAAFDELNSLLDKSITSNIHHKNYVARQKAKYAKLLSTLQ